ncbi:3-isopropylmalate/(R)-2-methylmalate dehydratase small subunit [Maribacter vaceletii]|uniref:3-isopropylmalate dehydratase small subunit n=1 Tax=Maribacter vaceletii TaxID=1206816 RepID=A0A495EE91_9FLAO|nr:3-isopropylmalate dehydratase small subunit [Maribacter vaceletii]RKR15205.1 3-isopropylmalate/(R)-2-methylmalate dehydratase small subunit [Maribacter vaceletii]
MSTINTKIEAKAHVYGDHIDTDRIIPGKYTKTLDLSTLANHVLEDLDPNFNKIVQQGDILVAGINFGCGSSREQAPLALKQSGVSVVIAEDFARIFFRNAINIGLPVLEIGKHNIQKGAELSIDLKNGKVTDLSANKTYAATKLPDIMIAILKEGGLVNYLKKNGTYTL